MWHACESLSGEAATHLHIKFCCQANRLPTVYIILIPTFSVNREDKCDTMHVYIKYFLISQSFLFQRRFIFVLLNNGRKVSATVLFLSAILRKKYNNMHREFVHFNFYVDMVRTILKKSWMSVVVLKNPWIQSKSLKSTWFLYLVLKSPWISLLSWCHTQFTVKVDSFTTE